MNLSALKKYFFPGIGIVETAADGTDTPLYLLLDTDCDKGETFEIVYGDYTVCRITYKGETTKAHFTSLDDKPMINVETNDGGYGLYFIERLSSGNLYLKLFDATYIAVVDDEIVMKKIAE